ncbi:hypothetical protein LSH36_5g02008 [Paralvinella palmiformis]|uniref:Uncharacterized protein n=1 Tax=Paralvinella palmiformis TaxID=53620 RepID=A0AAD9KEZ6_9ANNE|nr:hypothetical protein LSH36_5g02008 [Paralvinella palmiformis]
MADSEEDTSWMLHLETALIDDDCDFSTIRALCKGRPVPDHIRAEVWQMDGTEDDALYEDFLGEGVAETEDVADNDGYADYYEDFPATHEILEYN